MLLKGETAAEPVLPPGAPSPGFALLEALVAGALIGWILLVGLDFLILEKRAEKRLVAHRQAMRAIETAVEGVRSGLIIPREGTVDLGLLLFTAEIELRMEIEEEAAMNDLLHIRVEARYQVGSQMFSRDLETLVWQP